MSVTEEPGNGLAPGDQAQGDQARGDQARGDKALGEKDNRAYSRIYQKAIRMLASREHSRRELLEKLTRKSSDVPSDCIEQVLDALAEQGLQCDVRYAESLIRSRINRGYGPYYIRQELRSKGVAESVLQACEDCAALRILEQGAECLAPFDFVQLQSLEGVPV